MNALQAIYLVTWTLAGIALAGLLVRHPRLVGHGSVWLTAGLAILILSLMLVGLVSNTFVRHVVQVAPPP
jgi:hypothetical protein